MEGFAPIDQLFLTCPHCAKYAFLRRSKVNHWLLLVLTALREESAGLKVSLKRFLITILEATMIITVKTLQQKSFKIEIDESESVSA